MKKTIIIVIIMFAVAITSAITLAKVAPDNQKVNLKGTPHTTDSPELSLDEAMNSDKPSLVLIYTDWCTYCVRFMPKFKSLYNAYKNDYNFVLVNADYPQYESFLKELGLTGFPTVYIIDPKIDNRVYISNGYYSDVKKFRVELDRYLKVRSRIKL